MQQQSVRSQGWMRVALIAVVMLVLSCMFVSAAAAVVIITTTRQPLTPVKLAEKLAASIVRIDAAIGQDGAMGSGIVFRQANGSIAILTNAHVVEGASAIVVSLSEGGAPRHARIVGLSSCDDLAVLALDDTSGLTPVSLGKAPIKGEAVYALGFPNDSQQLTITDGLVSVAAQSIGRGVFIQTSAAINPGSSGGGLFNGYGELIGVNTLVARDTDNIGYAIDIHQAQPVLQTFAARPRLLWTGMNTEQMDWDDGTPVLVVTAVESGSPAYRMGVEPGDIVLSIENTDVRSPQSMCTILRSHTDGDAITIVVARLTDTDITYYEGQLTIGNPDVAQPLTRIP